MATGIPVASDFPHRSATQQTRLNLAFRVLETESQDSPQGTTLGTTLVRCSCVPWTGASTGASQEQSPRSNRWPLTATVCNAAARAAHFPVAALVSQENKHSRIMPTPRGLGIGTPRSGDRGAAQGSPSHSTPSSTTAQKAVARCQSFLAGQPTCARFKTMKFRITASAGVCSACFGQSDMLQRRQRDSEGIRATH